MNYSNSTTPPPYRNNNIVLKQTISLDTNSVETDNDKKYVNEDEIVDKIKS